MSGKQCGVSGVAHHLTKLFCIDPIKAKLVIFVVIIVIYIAHGRISSLICSLLLLILNTNKSVVFIVFFILVNEDVILVMDRGCAEGLPCSTCVSTLLRTSGREKPWAVRVDSPMHGF